jgi:hypothetical protein
MTGIDRRELLVAVAGAATAALWSRSVFTQTTKTKLVLLGTGGGPRPRKANSASAQVILIDNAAYVVDCGDGVARQLVLDNVPCRRFDISS